MGIKTKIAGLVIAMMALTVPMVFADQGGADKDSWHHGKDSNIMAKVLGLSEDQQKQMKDNRQKQKDAMKAVYEQIKSDREAINAELTKAKPDMARVNGIAVQLKSLLSQLVDIRLNSVLELKKIMTPEQFAGYMALEKAKEMMMKNMHHGKFGNKGGHEGFGKKDGACKVEDGQKHWDNDADKDHDDTQD